MSLSEKLMRQGSQPSGLLGRLVGNLMNLSHKKIYLWGLSHLSFRNDSKALDTAAAAEGYSNCCTVNGEGKVWV